MAGAELFDLFLRRLSRYPVFFLNRADKLILLAGNPLQIAIGQLAPSFSGFALILCPLAFDLIPVPSGCLLQFLMT